MASKVAAGLLPGIHPAGNEDPSQALAHKAGNHVAVACYARNYPAFSDVFLQLEMAWSLDQKPERRS